MAAEGEGVEGTGAGPRLTVRRGCLVLLAATWILVLLTAGIPAGETSSRAGSLLFWTAAGGTALGVLSVWDAWSSPLRWGLGALLVQGLVGAAWIAGAGSWWGWLVAALALASASAVGSGSGFAPEDSFKTVGLVLLSLLALAPIADALVAGPGGPPSVSVDDETDYTVEASTWERVGPGAGYVSQHELVNPNLPSMEVVTLTLPADAHRGATVEEAFREERTSYHVPFLFLFVEYQRETGQVHRLVDGWTIVELGYEKGEVSLGFLTDAEGERQVLLFRSAGTVDALHLFPPSSQKWERLVGFRFPDGGENSLALERLRGNVSVDGVRLDPPAEADERVDAAGAYERHTPVPPLLAAVLAAVLAPLLGRQGRPGG
jgi:hypothetical protein